MYNLHQATTALVQHDRDNLAAVNERHEHLEKTVVQRLKWAAGANPTLGQTLQLFEEALKETAAIVEVS